MVKALLVCREAELCTGGLAKQTGRSRCLVLSRQGLRAEIKETTRVSGASVLSIPLVPPEDRSKEPQEYLIPVQLVSAWDCCGPFSPSLGPSQHPLFFKLFSRATL